MGVGVKQGAAGVGRPAGWLAGPVGPAGGGMSFILILFFLALFLFTFLFIYYSFPFIFSFLLVSVL